MGNEKNKWRIELRRVGGDRKNIQIHVGKYQSHTVGCILVGKVVKQGVRGCEVSGSLATLKSMAREMGKYSARLGGNKSVPIDISVVVQ